MCAYVTSIRMHVSYCMHLSRVLIALPLHDVLASLLYFDQIVVTADDADQTLYSLSSPAPPLCL